MEEQLKVQTESKESRLRKPNYSKEEMLTIIQGVNQRKHILLGGTSHSVAAIKLKQKGWREICEYLCSTCGVQRTVTEIRKKWKDMLAMTKKERMCREKQLKAGVPCPPQESAITSMIFSILCHVATKEGDTDDVCSLDVNIDSMSSQESTPNSSSGNVVPDNMTGLVGSCSTASESTRRVENGDVCLGFPEGQMTSFSDLLNEVVGEQNGPDNKEARMETPQKNTSSYQNDEANAVKRKASASISTLASTASATVSAATESGIWMMEKEMLEKEKLKMEIEVLKLKRAKLKLEIGNLIEKKANHSNDHV